MKLTSETLKNQRMAIGISQAEIAKRAGVSRPTIIKYEKCIEPQLSKVLEAYCLEVYPVVGSLPAELAEIERVVKTIVENNLGVNCKVKINLEIGGEDEQSN